ncbi:hypothetical protein Tco_0943713 [Tanacetum coccineum]
MEPPRLNSMELPPIELLNVHKELSLGKLSDIHSGYQPEILLTHKILMEEDYAPASPNQRSHRQRPLHSNVMDQMLERLAGMKGLLFPDGFSGYFQIPMTPCDQKRTTAYLLHTETFATVACLSAYACSGSVTTMYGAENLAVRSICPDWKTQYGKRQVILKEIMIVFLLRRYIGDLSWSSLKPRGLDFANLPRGLATMDPPGDIMRANLTAKRSLTPVLLGPPSIKDAHRFVKKTVILERDIGENGPPGREQKLDEATMGLPHKLTKPPRVYSLQACVWKGCISIEARAHAHTGNYSKQTAI